MAQEPSGRRGPATVSWYASNRKGMNMETFEQHVKKVVATELGVDLSRLHKLCPRITMPCPRN